MSVREGEFRVFGRSHNSEAKAAEAAKLLAKTAPANPPPLPTTSNVALPDSSVLASDLAIIGQNVLLISRGRLQVDGEVRGNINGRDVIVGQTGHVSGVITAQSIEVRGQVKGALRGTNITLQPTAHVDGDIVKMVLVIQEGAHFDGNVRRAKDPSEVTANLEVPGR